MPTILLAGGAQLWYSNVEVKKRVAVGFSLGHQTVGMQGRERYICREEVCYIGEVPVYHFCYFLVDGADKREGCVLFGEIDVWFCEHEAVAAVFKMADVFITV
jgi:hypothetical protein